MNFVDSHVHTSYSPDGHDEIATLLGAANSKGLSYLATTDHLDYDLKFGKNHTPVVWNHINLDKYFNEWTAAKKKAENIEFCFGIEAGYENDEAVFEKYRETFAKYPFDVIINSVHFVNGMDVYFPIAFFFKSKRRMYKAYLDKVLSSLDAPYQYDIVAHLGYVTRNAPYKNKALRYSDFPQTFDKILRRIIEKGKALEVNTHHDMNPTREILQRYFDLGGRKLSFGSDSHRMELCKDFEKVCKILKEIGFTHFSVFNQHKENLVSIEV